MVRAQAAQALWKLRRQARGAVDVLLEWLASPDYWHYAEYMEGDDGEFPDDTRETLVEMGKKSRSCLLALARNARSPGGRGPLAIEILAAIGPRARAVAWALRRARRDDDPKIRLAAAEALWDVVGEAGPAVTMRLAQLRDGDMCAQREAARALERYGPQARAAIPALVEALQLGDRILSSNAARALDKIGPQAKPALAALAKTLKDRGQTLPAEVIAALGTAGPAAR
jgi:HEAT repeat protein